jgi:hypothetical protein
VDSVHRAALVEAVGELQRGEVREDLLKAELVTSREQLLALTAELADVRAERRLSLTRS